MLQKPLQWTKHHGYEINTFAGVEEIEDGQWVAYTKDVEAGYFETKEDAEMGLLRLIFSNYRRY